MQVHTFRAESLQAALQQVRHSLGPDASILHTRQTRSGPLGLFSKRLIEVAAIAQAAVDASTSSIPDSVRPQPTPQPTSQPAPPHPPQLDSGSRHAASPPEACQPETQQHVLPGSTPALRQLQAEMAASGIPSELMGRLAGELQRSLPTRDAADVQTARRQLLQLIASQLKPAAALVAEVSAETAPQVVALIGPTGVGKTTTLAKLAAQLQREAAARVGLIAVDTTRLGAVDQLLQYAEMLDTPLEVVGSVEQLRPAITRLQDCDVILLDTAGRAPRDRSQLRELQQLLQLAQPSATGLVLSATSAVLYVQHALQHFAQLNPSSLIITKMDEAVGFGSWLPLLTDCSLPISYVTAGQRVPQDMWGADPQRISSLLLGSPAAADDNLVKP